MPLAWCATWRPSPPTRNCAPPTAPRSRKVSAFYSGIPLHAGLWRAVQDFAATEEAARLEGERRRLLTKTIDNFRRHGANLDPAGKQRLEALDVELSRLTIKFAENVLDSTNAFELMITDPAGLAGLPPSAVAAARESAARKGREGWRFTLHAPDYFAVMTYLDDAGKSAGRCTKLSACARPRPGATTAR